MKTAAAVAATALALFLTQGHASEGFLALLGDLDWIAEAWRRRRRRSARGGYLWRR